MSKQSTAELMTSVAELLDAVLEERNGERHDVYVEDGEIEWAASQLRTRVAKIRTSLIETET